MRIAICDDDNLWKTEAEAIIKEYYSEKGESTEILFFNHGQDLYDYSGDPISLVLMDIELDKENGIAVAGRLNEMWPDCHIVYCTNYYHYALDVYETRHIYFVVKSQFRERLPQVLRQIRLLEMREKAELYYHVVGQGMTCFALRDILYFERKTRVTILHTKNGVYSLWEKISDIMESLPEGTFTRCHSSFLVLFASIFTRDGNTYILKNEERIPISRNYSKKTKTEYLMWCEEEMR